MFKVSKRWFTQRKTPLHWWHKLVRFDFELENGKLFETENMKIEAELGGREYGILARRCLDDF